MTRGQCVDEVGEYFSPRTVVFVDISQPDTAECARNHSVRHVWAWLKLPLILSLLGAVSPWQLLLWQHDQKRNSNMIHSSTTQQWPHLSTPHTPQPCSVPKHTHWLALPSHYSNCCLCRYYCCCCGCTNVHTHSSPPSHNQPKTTNIKHDPHLPGVP
jgi:hypothetical protein